MTTDNRTSYRRSELHERGWTDELIRVFHPGVTGYFNRDTTHAIEQDPEFQTDAATAATGQDVYAWSSDLKARGWTKAMITGFLGDPYKTIPVNRSGARVAHVWRMTDVLAAEAQPGFAERHAAAQKRAKAGRAAAQARARDTKTAAAAEMRKRFRYRPPSNKDTLVAAALAHVEQRNAEYGNYSSVEGADPATIRRWCGNYLRHQCSNYDRLINDLHTRHYGKPGVRALYEDVIREHVDTVVNTTLNEFKL